MVGVDDVRFLKKWLLYGLCRTGWCVVGAGVVGVWLEQKWLVWLVYGRNMVGRYRSVWLMPECMVGYGAGVYGWLWCRSCWCMVPE